MKLTQYVSSYTSMLSNRLKREMTGFVLNGQYAPTQERVIHFIIAHDGEPVYQRELEREFMMRPASASELLKKLEDNDLIRRVPDPDDSRKKRIEPTEKALQYRGKVLDDLQKLENAITAALTPEEIETWKAITEKMIRIPLSDTHSQEDK